MMTLFDMAVEKGCCSINRLSMPVDSDELRRAFSVGLGKLFITILPRYQFHDIYTPVLVLCASYNGASST